MTTIAFAEAAKSHFRQSTLEELKAYCDEQGIKYTKKEALDPGALKLKLLRTLGLHAEYETPDSRPESPALPKSRVVPEYNLSLSRAPFQGRRHRVMLRRPEGVKKENRRRISVNGYVCELRYDHVESVPEPIWLKIRDEKVGYARPERVLDSEGFLERQTTTLEHRGKYAYQYEGIEESTKNLCGSLKEWYQKQGYEWFDTLSQRELKRVADELDLRVLDKEGKLLPKDEMCYRILVDVFGEAPIKEQAA